MYNWKKTLYICRGLPGSGKSTLALQLVDGNLNQVVENDDYWFTPNESNILTYQYVASQAHLAAQWCMAEAFRKLHLHDKVAVANTFVLRKYILPYLEEAYHVKAKIQLLEPQTTWAKDIQQCNSKNVHNVPLDVIARMKEQWEELNQQQVNAFLGI